MTETSIQQVSPNNGALNAEHYQSFEMAKANDDVLGSDNIAQIRSYAAYARAQAQAIHKTIAATSGIEDVAAIKSEATETAQTFAKVGIYADQRIGEILRELPTKQGKRTDVTSSTTQDKVTKRQAMAESGISKSQAYDLQAMAANPEVVEAVIAKATEEGRVVSRSQVLDAIKAAKEQAEHERDMANAQRKATMKTLEEQFRESEAMEDEIASLKRQLAERPEPEVIEREVEVVREIESASSKRRVRELEHLERLHSDDNQNLRRQVEDLRKKLERAKVLLEEKGYEDNAAWDISTLTTATNQYLRKFGGKLWAFDQLYRVDEVTQQEFAKAMTSLAAFSQNVVEMLKHNTNGVSHE